MLLRPLEQRDLEAVRQLRNRNRQWFFDDSEVSAEAHERWFLGLADRPVRFYVIEVDGRVVGTASVTERPDGLEFGNLILDDAYRGRGLAARAVAELTAAPGRYYALVKTENQATLGVLGRAGFEAVSVRLERTVD